MTKVNPEDVNLEDIEFAIKVTCDVHGDEIYEYEDEDDRDIGLKKLTRKIEKLEDGIERDIFFVEHGVEEIVAEWNGDTWDSHIQKDDVSTGYGA